MTLRRILFGGSLLVLAAAIGAARKPDPQARGRRTGHSKRRHDLADLEPLQLGRCDGGAEHARRGRRVKAAITQGRVRRLAEPLHHLAASGQRHKQILAARADLFGRCKGRRIHRGAEVKQREHVDIVKLDAVRGYGVGEGGLHGGHFPGSADHRGLRVAAGDRRELAGHFPAFALATRYGNAQVVEKQALDRLAVGRRKFRITERGKVLRKSIGDGVGADVRCVAHESSSKKSC